MRLSPSSPCSSMRSISDNQMIQKSLPVYDREGFFGLYDAHIRSAERQIVRIPADFLHLLQIDIAEEQLLRVACFDKHLAARMNDERFAGKLHFAFCADTVAHGGRSR